MKSALVALCCGVALMLGVAGCSGGQDEARLKEISQKAEGGDAQAQYELGRLYDHGAPAAVIRYALTEHCFHSVKPSETNRAVKMDLSKAREWYEKSAAQGNVDACNALGDLYTVGFEEFLQDKHKAVQWYEKAAARGNAYAQLLLGLLYWGFDEVNRPFSVGASPRSEMPFLARKKFRDEAKAKKWFELAAAQGDPEAQFMLGYYYYQPASVIKDMNRTLRVDHYRKWYKMAADQGHPLALYHLGLDYEMFWQLDLAKEYLEKACRKGVDDACHRYRIVLEKTKKNS